MNFFDDPESDSEANDSFFTQASPPRPARASTTGPRPSDADTTTSDFRDSSLFENRTREESVTLEEILAGGKAPVQLGTDVQELMRCWRNERGSPELLMYPTQLINRLMLNLAKKKETVERLNSVEGQPENNYIKLTIAATENMRAAFTLKSFLRARLHKIEKFAQYLLQDLEDANRRLSPVELRLTQSFVAAWTEYMESGAITNMPEKIQTLDDEGMVVTPNLSEAVFVRAVKRCGPVTLPDGEKMELPEGSQHMLRYSTVRELIKQGLVDLI